MSKKIIDKSKKLKGSKRKFAVKREGLVHEETKCRLLIKGLKCKENVQNLLRDIYKLFPRTYTKMVRGISRGDVINSPWDDMMKMEQLAHKHGAGISIYANSSKKRPFRLVFTRYYDGHVLDMYEFNVLSYIPLSINGKLGLPKYGSKPLVISQGAIFEINNVYKNLRNMLLDIFSGYSCRGSKIYLKGIDHLIVVSAIEDENKIKQSSGDQESHIIIDIRNYAILMNSKEDIVGEIRSDANLIQSGVPHISLIPLDFNLKLKITKYKLAEKLTLKAALAVPKEVKPKVTKNISTNILGETVGRIHVGKQDLSNLNTPHASISSSIGDKK
ncbi:BRIX domain-containing protein [Cryptosporidium andersoni]|uniref:Ribosome production factor 2 homolog n=1 Tax=Cryptosporidium andersoni TaxID=117008 RepID=A0A1J4MUP0_9CRYT|nr:BRIX domain-containing protein [Cryptosporidium andersoni]